MAENLMLMCGAKITSVDDKLMKVPVNYIADKLKNPNPEIEAKIRQMRDMLAIDEKKYREFKKQLPYIVAGWFAPAVRRTENFAYIEAFFVDLDHLQENNKGIVSLKNLINRDSRVMVSFVSPGGNGLKILFHLKEKIYDQMIFKTFYKEFVQKFAAQYNLLDVVDAKTCDVTRACFMSIDKDVYFNPQADVIDINTFININNPQLMTDTIHSQQKEEKQQKKTAEPTISNDPDAEAIKKIAEILDQKVRVSKTSKPKSEPVVPEILNELLTGLKEYISKVGAEVYNVINIQNAKKLQIKLGLKKAEINVFHGKRGFSVVSVPKGETDGEFNEMMRQLIICYINEN